MTLKLYNSLTRTKETFTPLDPENVRMYVCGPTVYDRAHIGNARPVVVFDVLYRLLKHHYKNVTYARNITDIDDKIITRALKEGISIKELTEKTTSFFHEDMGALNAKFPDHEPRATQYVEEMIDMIQRLIDKGHAYAADGHVLFSVDSFSEYGALSKVSKDDQIAGARVEVAPYKKSPEDFVLWKPSSDLQPGWESPWGRGRPGWHIECSAMGAKLLGKTFDIHGGGRDLLFPHHENEIAQSTCTHNAPLANYWLHNGHVIVEGEKMSKSLGNFFTVKDKLQEHKGETLRYVLLSTHYRQPLDWTRDMETQAKKCLDRLYGALKGIKDHPELKVEPDPSLLEALEDDLNTPLALSTLHELTRKINKMDNDLEKQKHQKILKVTAEILGLLEGSPDEWFKCGDDLDVGVELMIKKRVEAKKNKDFETADQIRSDLLKKGIILEDTPTGTQWRRSS